MVSNSIFSISAEEVGKLHRDHAARSEQRAEPRHEPVQVRHVSEHVVADQEVGSFTLGPQPPGQVEAEELDQRRDAGFPGGGRDVGGRLDSEHGDAALDERAQEIAVVARDLDHLARRVEAEPIDHLADVAAGVLHPAVRERGEIRIVSEDLLRGHGARQLDQETTRADEDPQRIEPFRLVELRRSEVGVREWRSSEVHECDGERRAARPALVRGLGRFRNGLARLRLTGIALDHRAHRS